MKTTREFCPASRYIYDMGLCSISNGFAQVDISQDAEYFGIWTNPFKFIIFSYIEGDCVTKECRDAKEFVYELDSMYLWHTEYGFSFKIDPGLQGDIEQRFIELGLEHLLH